MTTIFTIPVFPISVNAMFADGKTRRVKSQRYADWVQEAGWELRRQRILTVRGQVRLTYTPQDGIDNRLRDAGNFEKGVTDLLVEHGIIEADHNKIVRAVTSEWDDLGEVKGVRVTITPVGANRVPETPKERAEQD